MIELANASIEQIDERIARIEAERDSLLALRDHWVRYKRLREPMEQPGSARSGSREQATHGRRAPAAKAAAPSSPASGLVGTPTPASQLPASRGGVSGAQPSPSSAAAIEQHQASVG